MDIQTKSSIKKNKKTTSYEVASLAGVSQSTVSRIFNPKWNGKIKPEIRDRIMEAVYKLNYNPNAIARSLTSQKTKIVGIVMPKTMSRVFSHILNAITYSLQKMGMQALVFTIDLCEQADNAVNQMLQYRVEGVIVISTRLSVSVATTCLNSNTPIILFNEDIPDIAINSVKCDFFKAGQTIAEFLLNGGFKKLALISGGKNEFFDGSREEGFKTYLKEHGVSEWAIELGDYSYKSGYEAAERLFSKRPAPDSIFCASDEMALGALDYIRFKLDIQVPENVSVIGFDDNPQSSQLPYQLTTVRYPIDDMIESMMEILEEKMNSDCIEPKSKVFEMEMVVRNTTRIAAARG